MKCDKRLLLVFLHFRRGHFYCVKFTSYLVSDCYGLMPIGLGVQLI